MKSRDVIQETTESFQCSFLRRTLKTKIFVTELWRETSLLYWNLRYCYTFLPECSFLSTGDVVPILRTTNKQLTRPTTSATLDRRERELFSSSHHSKPRVPQQTIPSFTAKSLAKSVAMRCVAVIDSPLTGHTLHPHAISTVLYLGHCSF